jgi:membrane associated rhomboid family serine protease
VIPLKDNIRLVHVPVVTIALILTNLVVYLVAISHGGSIIGGPTSETIVRYGAIPYEFSHLGQHCDLGLSGLGQGVLCTGQAGVVGSVGSQPPTWATAFATMFLQPNVLALAVSVLFLAVFAMSVEDALGRVRFIAFYLLGALAAFAVQVAVAPDSVDPLLGAPGAIAAVLGGYSVLYPRARILAVATLPFFFGPVTTPAWTMVVLWLALDVVLGALGLTTSFGAAGASYYANVAGFAFGLLAVRSFARRETGELAKI